MQRNTTKSGVESNATPARTSQAAPTRATTAGGAPAKAARGKAKAAGKPSKAGRAPAKASGEPADKHAGEPADKHGSERARDEQREGGPRYGGGAWEVADERGDRRFGHARNDAAEPIELAARAADDSGDELPEDPEVAAAAGEIEGGGQHAGMGRGDKPRKSKSDER